MAGKIHVGDIGMAFRATAVDQDGVPINVSNVYCKIFIQKARWHSSSEKWKFC
jgi:hypothetical protein